MSRYDPIRDDFFPASSGGLNPSIPAFSQGDRLDALLDRQRGWDDDYRANRERRRGPPRYGDTFEDDYDDDVYDEGLSPRGMLSPQEMFSPLGMMSSQGMMSPLGMSRAEDMLDIGRSRAMEDPLVRMARDGYDRQARDDYERDLDEQMYANMGYGREQDLGMDIMDRDFDLFERDPREEPGSMQSIEREPGPMDAFYGEPQLDPRRCRGGRAITSGHRLPPGAGQGAPMPREALLEGHRMGNPQGDMLMGARPDPRLQGTPVPGAFMDDMGPPMRRRR